MIVAKCNYPPHRHGYRQAMMNEKIATMTSWLMSVTRHRCHIIPSAVG
ncbi:hypothetical protein EDWATA_01439 [Edwardsiella tarda ATCC 23685]|uniref:Uncharacterized protein n=1 Tax=Edwardsiella tarda ATCC 23685 TaxID=500638 RepID=D4F3X3_EDWTA|nr:hypothetical protein EDWATA_01439 [Edwardsiella tarda ATCC 23685]